METYIIKSGDWYTQLAHAIKGCGENDTIEVSNNFQYGAAQSMNKQLCPSKSIIIKLKKEKDLPKNKQSPKK